MNRVMLSGTVVKEPEARTTQAGKLMYRFSIAVRRPYKNRQTGEYDSDFFNCMDWGSNADYIGKYVRKGNKVIVDGQIQSGSYTNKDGEKRYYTEIALSSIENLTWEKNTQLKTDRAMEQTAPYMTGFKEIPEDDLTDQDLPF